MNSDRLFSDRTAITNLLENSLKYRRSQNRAVIRFGCEPGEEGWFIAYRITASVLIPDAPTNFFFPSSVRIGKMNFRATQLVWQR